MVPLVADAETVAELEQAGVPVVAADRHEAALVVHLDAVDRVVAHLDGEQRRLLLVEDVPGVEHAVLARSEEDGGSGGAPAAVGKVLGVGAAAGGCSQLPPLLPCPASPGPHDGALLDVLTPDPGAPVSHREEILKTKLHAKVPCLTNILCIIAFVTLGKQGFR